MISNYKNNVHSQNGEDGIIEHLLKYLPTDKWCCEFGAWDGKYLSNTFNLVSNHLYSAVYIESDANKFKELERLTSDHRINAINARIDVDGQNSLDNILLSTNIPRDFDILSIDIDGIDYLIWESLKNYTPKIVVIEINSGMNPYHVMSDEDLRLENMLKHVYEGSHTSGVNFMTCCSLAKEKGYKLAAHTGNLIFVDSKYSSTVEGLATDDNVLQYWRR